MTYEKYLKIDGDTHYIAPKEDGIPTYSVPPGIYECYTHPYSPGFLLKEMKVNSDEIIDVPDTAGDEIMSEIDLFLSDKVRQNFERYKYLHKRGILLYGPQGTGKSVIVLNLMRKMTERGGIALFNPSPGILAEVIKGIRDIEPSREVLVAWEEFDSLLNNYEPTVLQILDGQKQFSNVVFVATTNYIDNISDRVKNRPGRFATVKYVGPLSRDARRIILSKKLLAPESDNIEQWIEYTDGMSFDQIKDMIVSVCCLDIPMVIAASKLRNLSCNSEYLNVKIDKCVENKNHEAIDLSPRLANNYASSIG